MLATRYLSVKILAILRSGIVPSLSVLCPHYSYFSSCSWDLVPNFLRSAPGLLQVTRAPLPASVHFRTSDERDLNDLTHCENLHNIKSLPNFTILLRKCCASSTKHYHCLEAPPRISLSLSTTIRAKIIDGKLECARIEVINVQTNRTQS